MWLPLISMLVFRAVDTSDPFVEEAVYVAFAAVHCILALSYLYLRAKIKAANDQTPLAAPKAKGFGEDPNTKAEVEHTYVEAYDLDQLNELYLKKYGLTLAIIGVMVWKFQAIIPLMFQCLHNPMQLYQHNVFKIHVLGTEATGALKRPWAVEDPRPTWLKNMQESASNEAADDKKKK